MATVSTSKVKISPAVHRAKRKRFTTPVLIDALYKSKFEAALATIFRERGIVFEYEPDKISYLVPQRRASYKPDFKFKGASYYIEAKGWFTADDRKKLIDCRESNPGIDIRLVFQGNASKSKIHPKSETTYAKWCDDHGFLWSDKGSVPDAWLEEIE